MRSKHIDALKIAIRQSHGCHAEHLDSVYVRESSPGGRLWEGPVEIFVTDHPDAGRCYAWEGDRGGQDIVAVLGRMPIGSARMAVRAELRLNHAGQAPAA